MEKGREGERNLKREEGREGQRGFIFSPAMQLDLLPHNIKVN